MPDQPEIFLKVPVKGQRGLYFCVFIPERTCKTCVTLEPLPQNESRLCLLGMWIFPWAVVSDFRQLCQRDPAFYWLWPLCPLKIVFKQIIFLNKLTWHKSSSYASPPASNLTFWLLYVSSPLFFLTGSFMWPPCGKLDKELPKKFHLFHVL